ncbi:MAG: RNA polymerase sigma factor [Proteobacteria bacterium]|nr:RNA polymerase sigma factor [Pseudomonadota bacterium]
MSWLREIDTWFTESVLPFASHYRAYARRLTENPCDAEDLVQEAYAKVLGSPDWRRLESPERFVLTTIRNLAFDRFRKEKVVGIRQIGSLELNAVPDPTPDVFAQEGARQELELVLKAFEGLPEQIRTVLALRRMHGLSPGQIATKLNLSVSTVEKHMAKGLRLLTTRVAVSQSRTNGLRQSILWRQRAGKKESR